MLVLLSRNAQSDVNVILSSCTLDRIQRSEASENKDTWWWDEEVKEIIRKRMLAKKRWDIQRVEESKHEYKEMRREAKKGVEKDKSKAYDELY